MIDISYKPLFVRLYAKLPRELQREVKEKIALFARDPRMSSLRTHKLRGALDGCLAFSVNYSYRIVFMWEGRGRAVLIAVGDHAVYD